MIPFKRYLAAMALVLMVSPTVSAEDGDTAAPAVESAPDVAATQTTASTEALEQQLAAQQAQIAALTGELGAVKTRMDAAEEAAAQKELEAAAEAFRCSCCRCSSSVREFLYEFFSSP